MANWKKLNKEFKDVFNSISDKNWDDWVATLKRKNIRPKLRRYIVRNIPTLLISDINKIEVFIGFVPINRKYYKIISATIIDTNDYHYKNIEFVLEKLTNNKSLL